jgi:GrpB-like predicted nucleotidyltransferase (UPF0157 family)
MNADERPRLVRVDARWASEGAAWCARVGRALGDALDGGSLLEVAHIGATAVPGLLAKPTIDLLARTHPWPLPADALARLADLGFVHHGEHGLPGRTYHTLGRHEVHLHVVDPASGHAHRHVALRDLLRGSAEARARYEAAKEAALAVAAAIPDARAARAAYQDAKAGVLAELEAEARDQALARTGFGPAAAVAAALTEALADATGRWAIAGGWALDAAAGTASRHHDDVDVAVDAAAGPALLDALTALGAQVAWVVGGGPARYRPRRPGGAHPSGGHQAHARWNETWLDVVLEPWTSATWRYRPAPTLALPLDRAVRRVVLEGVEVPIMAPETVLLFKANRGGGVARPPKDDADFARALALLDAEARAWLHDALPPGHPWRAVVAAKSDAPRPGAR